MEKSNRKAKVSLVLGILNPMIFVGLYIFLKYYGRALSAFIDWCITTFSTMALIVLPVVGVVLGYQVKRVDPSNRMAKAGRALCWIMIIYDIFCIYALIFWP